MTQSQKRPNLAPRSDRSNQTPPSNTQPKEEDIVTSMVKKIDQFTSLQEYKISVLVEDTEKLGTHLVLKGLKTNQIRKFLDAVKRFKVQQDLKNELSEKSRDELHILRYQLAYAAARQQKSKDPGPVEPLKQVLETAIKKVNNEIEDFNRLVQLIESIVAYHKAAGGKDQ